MLAAAGPDPWAHWGAIAGVALGSMAFLSMTWRLFRWFDTINRVLVNSKKPTKSTNNNGQSITDKLDAIKSAQDALHGEFHMFKEEFHDDRARQWNAIARIDAALVRRPKDTS
jgi:hypothetical protein